MYKRQLLYSSCCALPMPTPTITACTTDQQPQLAAVFLVERLVTPIAQVSSTSSINRRHSFASSHSTRPPWCCLGRALQSPLFCMENKKQNFGLDPAADMADNPRCALGRGLSVVRVVCCLVCVLLYEVQHLLKKSPTLGVRESPTNSTLTQA